MGPYGPHITVVVYYACERKHLFRIFRWCHIYHGFYFFIYWSDPCLSYPKPQIFHIGLSRGRFLYSEINTIAFKFLLFVFYFLPVIAPIIFRDYQQVIDVCLDKLETKEHFVHFLLENDQVLTQNHC